ncbi:hypothetical protein SAMN07250955_11417 [Arboricoccus pini]|uniref:Uncharacterized protein n=1 Tax=Arboricoccus pini TaxID=1963835 RepID=A0A212RT32_9PROT|nr:hypothetical protein [Arboricoccus pini]SNB75824.1 hypothetical protein SAMN07250955_11417 [Arboricoccus pini]
MTWTTAGQSPPLFLLGLLIGIWLPDIDLAIPYLPHRSGLTHSILPGLILLFIGQPRLAAGILAATAIHLSADMFPVSWRGSALIYLPLTGGLGLWSMAFLGLNVLAALLIAYHLMQRPALDSLPMVTTGLLALAYLLLKEWSLSGFVVFAACAWLVRRVA